jgi:hypothetical protein
MTERTVADASVGPHAPLRIIGGDQLLREDRMSALIRLDQTGHTVLANWSAGDSVAVQDARDALRAELDRGYFAVTSDPDGTSEQVRELPLDAELVILRRPIAGG